MDLDASSLDYVGKHSFLDTDLCKITMQCAVFTYFKDVEVTYALKNRTPKKKLSRAGFEWLEAQMHMLEDLSLSPDELSFLQANCPYLNEPYLRFLKELRLEPRTQIRASFGTDIDKSSASGDDLGEIYLEAKGPWATTILYEVPILALISEAYFRFTETDWTHEIQEGNAYQKGMHLLEAGCVFAEYGTRRRRDPLTQTLVLRGLLRAKEEGNRLGLPGILYGTSNVLRAMQFGITPIGTISHEWIMGIAAMTGDYENATKTALTYWIGCYGESVLGIALPDTFGLPTFLRSFRQTIPTAARSSSDLKPDSPNSENGASQPKKFAEVFTGVRHDSGCPTNFVKNMRAFYDRECIATDGKTIVFSDSLNINQCLENKRLAEEAGFLRCKFGIGTFFTNDFVHLGTGKKSTPLNVVFKLSSVGSNAAIKISDSAGKSTGDKATIERVKQELGYIEREWQGTDESARWDEDY